MTAPITTGALAAKLQPVARIHLQREDESAEILPRPAPNFERAVQGSLFNDRPKVVSIAPSGPARASRPRTSDGAPRPRKPRTVPEGQGRLDFLPPAPVKPKTLGTTVEAVIYCEAPVATPAHRACAAALDWSMVLLGYGLFLAVFYYMGGQFALTKTTVSVFAAMFGLIGFTYGLCFSFAGTETPGMRWTELRLITFDGFPPDRKQRMARFFGASISRSTLLGLLWSLADEESLAWQDHISRTFPTPEGLDHQTLRRR
jgi:uncharacterized RDD family membrane protein YckC